MDIVVISKQDLDIENVTVVNDMRTLDTTKYDGIVFHSSEGSNLEIVRCITSLDKKGKKVVYINNEINSLFYCLFSGIGADIYDSEDYLVDYEMLDYILSNYKETGMELKAPDTDLDVISNGVMALVTKGAEEVVRLAENELWLTTLNNAVNSLDIALERSNSLNGEVVGVLNSVSTLLSNLEDNMKNTEKEILELNKMVAEYDKKVRPNTPFMFSSYNVPITVKKVMYVKVYGNCKYLLSFLSAYQHYLKMNKQFSSKLLVMQPKLKLHMQKYSQKKIPQLSKESIGMVNLKAYDFFVTFEPKKSVLDAFFKENANLYIVVDMLYGDDMLEGYNVEKFCAINGVSDLEVYNLKPEKIISSLVGLPNNIMIPHILKYQEANEQSRRTFYFDRCEKMYKLIDKVLNLG